MMDLNDLVCLAEVAASLPSPRPGKKTSTSTVLDIARRNGMTIITRGRFRFLLRSELDKLHQREPVARATKGRTSPESKRILRDAGIIR